MMTKVYPHVCGATNCSVCNGVIIPGLSPRVWGNRRHVLSKHRQRRSIPTCVGQPKAAVVVGHVFRVYPHVCGATRQRNDRQ